MRDDPRLGSRTIRSEAIMKRFKLSYADRYCYAQCNGTHIIEADSLESARTLAKDWLIAHGGAEGLSWSVTQL